MWVKRLCNSIDAKWKVLAFELIGLNKNQLLKWVPSFINKVKGTFYKSLLTIWSEFIIKKPEDLCKNDFANERLFENQLFLVGKRPIDKRFLGDIDDSKIGDIWCYDKQTIKPKLTLEQQYTIIIPGMLYNQIYSTTNEIYKQIRKQNLPFCQTLNTPQKCLSEFSEVKSIDVYK